MDNLENDKPFSNNSYNNDCGEEINSIPSNEKGEEINDAISISKRSKKIAKAITSTALVLAIVTLFAPMFARACNKIAEVEFKKLFACEIAEYSVSSSSIDCVLTFFRLDDKTQTVIEGEVNVKDYGEDVLLILSNDKEKLEKIITQDLINNEYHAVFQGLESDSKYTLKVKIGDSVIFEKDFTTYIENR